MMARSSVICLFERQRQKRVCAASQTAHPDQRTFGFGGDFGAESADGGRSLRAEQLVGERLVAILLLLELL